MRPFFLSHSSTPCSQGMNRVGNSTFFKPSPPSKTLASAIRGPPLGPARQLNGSAQPRAYGVLPQPNASQPPLLTLHTAQPLKATPAYASIHEDGWPRRKRLGVCSSGLASPSSYYSHYISEARPWARRVHRLLLAPELCSLTL